jgi:pyruvate dehydrogenase E1 component
VSYDPTFGFEVAVIIQDGLRRMFAEQEDVYYYVTLMNENYAHPALPKDAEEGILRGMYRIREGRGARGEGRGKNLPQVQLLGAGTILREVLAAAEMLEQDWKVSADVWSVTSFTELRRDGMGVERWNRLHPDAKQKQSWVEQCLDKTTGPVIAASDYMRTVPDMIRNWVSHRYVALGTDGFGRSDTRVALRDFFEVDRNHVTVAALKALADEGKIDVKTVGMAIEKYGIAVERANPWDI